MGLKIYDMVAGKQVVKKSYLLSKSKALEEFPMLKAEKLVGAIVYYDGEFCCCYWLLSLFVVITVDPR